MRRGLSTGKPTKEEAAYIVACKEGSCQCCDILRESGREGCDGEFQDFHHMKSGNLRRGHMFGIGLCAYHHRRHCFEGMSSASMRNRYGPSLMDGSHRFHLAFGSDDELLERQRRYLEGE